MTNYGRKIHKKSISYVPTSDNKYVQFRYMGTETTGTPNPFRDTTNWYNDYVSIVKNEQTGHAEIFAGNTYIGRVASVGDFQKLDKEINGIYNYPKYVGLLEEQGTIIYSLMYRYNVINVNGGETFILTANENIRIFVLSEFDYPLYTDLPYTATFATGEGIRFARVHNFTLPSDARFVLVQRTDYTGVDYVFTSLFVGEYDILHTLPVQMVEVQNSVNKTIPQQIAEKITLVQGLYNTSTLTYTENTTRAVTQSFVRGKHHLVCNNGYFIRGRYVYNLINGEIVYNSFESWASAPETSKLVNDGNAIYKYLFQKADDTQDITNLNEVIASFENEEDFIDSEVMANKSLTIEKGLWNSTASSSVHLTRAESNNRMRSAIIYRNNGNYINCKCKSGYEANVYYYNPYTSTYLLSGWNANQQTKQSSNDYQQVVLMFKRTDGADVSTSDLDCVDSFVIESDISELQITVGEYAERPSSGYETFNVSCNTVVADTQDEALTAQDSEYLANDACRLYLPTAYRANGKPTRLIIHCHGASVNYNYNNFSNLGVNAKILDYLVAKGYAVLLVNGMAGNSTLQIGTTAGSPLAYQSHIKAYNYATKKYNLYKDGCFVYGISAGSIPALQIANFTDIPVLAQIIYCGIYSVPRAFMLLGGYNTYAKQMKHYIAQQYAFRGTWNENDWSETDPVSDNEWKHIIDNVLQFAGWNSYLRGATTRMTQEQFADFVGDYYGNNLPIWIDAQNITFDTIEQLLMTIKVQQKNTSSPSGDLLTAVNAEKALYDSISLYRDVPLKIYHARNDDTAPYRYAQYYYDMLKRGGSQVELRTFVSGGHSPYGNDVTVTIDGVSVNTCVFAIESLLFLQRFE